ncbi:uncharacterized protein LOC110835818 isoform X2 [Zootermopsis nevadensis]|uniref:uncharacterized protein LOC110835818 isoform X2 n=1 Tax=Zootermopsis nevadensis TaxID=136037 RepID=UPI000B8EB5A6|nr:uncharacterized protein LOC110835818 isoform X2 [Zootermopsis nevadensis]
MSLSKKHVLLPLRHRASPCGPVQRVGSAAPSVGYVRRSGMVESRRDVERAADSDSVPGPKEDDDSEGDLHHLEREGRQGVDQWSDQVVLDDSEEEEDAESTSDIYRDDGDDDDSDLKIDSACSSNALALEAKKISESRPSFGNIVVSSSSDVHFGNKTFYNGPVTIKQFVCTTKNGTIDAHHSENGYRNCDDSKVDVDEVLDPMSSGLPNGKVQCPTPSSPNVIISVPSALAVTSEPSPGVNGSLLQIWQPSGNQEVEPMVGWKNRMLQWGRKMKCTRTRLTMLAIICVCVMVVLVAVLFSLPRLEEETATNNAVSGTLRIINRRTWLAQPAVRPSNPLQHPVPYVVILHTATDNCSTQAECVFIVRHIQTFHIESNGWNDIGYSFLVGGDGNVYEGRGWDTEGAFAYGYNSRAIGIAFIGTFTVDVPEPKQILAGKQLMELGVTMGKISPHYKLLAHRQVSPTESPGLAFYEFLKTWPHWAEHP